MAFITHIKSTSESWKESSADLLVFGKLAGEGAFEYIQSEKLSTDSDSDQIRTIIKNATSILNRETGENPYLLHESLQDVMQNNVGIVRTEELLSGGIIKLSGLWNKYKKVKADGASQFNPGWHEALALRNMLITSEAVAQAALMREESRGSHTGVDFPNEQNEWLKYNLVIKKNADGTMGVSRTLRDEPEPELKRLANLTIEEIETEIEVEQ